MSVFEVKDVVCDYGVYEDGELKLILNSRCIALRIVELLKEDESRHKELQRGIYYGKDNRAKNKTTI